MSNATNALENSVLDHIVGNATYTPGTLYIALATAVTDAEAGTFTEVSQTNTDYVRQSAAAANWASASGGSVTTSANIEFPVCGSANYGTVTHVVVVGGTGADTYGGGTPIIIKELTSHKTVESGDTFVINSGNLTVSLD